MSYIQIGSLVNPNRTMLTEKSSFSLPKDTDLFGFSEKMIPDDIEYVRAVDNDGHCIGTISAERVQKILRALHYIPLEPLLDELAEAVVAVDKNGIIFYVNPAYTRVLGVPAGKILGKNMHIIESGASLLDVLRTGKPVVRENNWFRPYSAMYPSGCFPC